MKMKLIVFLLVIYITFSTVLVQAQPNMFEKTRNMDVVVTEDINKTVICNMTGNSFFVGILSNTTENMTNDQTENAIRNFLNTQSINATGKMENATKSMTYNITGRLFLIEDMANMTESAVMVGKIENVPGKVVIIGKMDKEANATGMEGKIDKMTLLMKGNMNGTITCNMTENMANVTENTSNMAVLMKGNMTGIITGDMTKKIIKTYNFGEAEMAENMSNVTNKLKNMSNMVEPTEFNMNGNMVIIQNISNLTEAPEVAENITEISEEMENIKKLDENNMTDISESISKAKEMDENMSSMTGMEWENNNSTVHVYIITNVITNVITTQIGLN